MMQECTFKKIMLSIILIAMTLLIGRAIVEVIKPKTIIVKSTTPHEIRIVQGDTTYIYKGELIR